MTLFQIGLRPNRRAAGRFVAHVRRTIQRAFIEEKKRTGIKQSDIARELGVDRSVISRELIGKRDISLSRAAEYALVLGKEILFDFVSPQAMHGNNRPLSPGSVQSATSFYSNIVKLNHLQTPAIQIAGV